MVPIAASLLTSGVAAANGANDNCKGVATLVGARILTPRRALWLGHLATLAGAVASVIVARGLIEAFQGKGLLPPELVGGGALLGTVAAAAALTVALATVLRMPVSTTHALAGGLVGAGLVMAGAQAVRWSAVASKLLLPLAFSPLVSAGLAAVLYPLLHRWRLRLGVTEETCVCVGPERNWVPVAAAQCLRAQAGVQAAPETIGLTVLDGAECQRRYQGRVIGASAARLLDGVHVVSAGALSFARGMNDAPKIAALMVGLTAAWTFGPAVAMVAVAMLLGGWVGAPRVLGTMSDRITDFNAGSAVTANVIGSALVILASFFALPVSTTHVTCGAIFGIGVAQRRTRWRTIGTILAAWILTLPLAAGLAAAIALVASRVSI